MRCNYFSTLTRARLVRVEINPKNRNSATVVPSKWRDGNGAREYNVVRCELLANNNAIRRSMRTLLSSQWRMLDSATLTDVYVWFDAFSMQRSSTYENGKMAERKRERWALTYFLRCRTQYFTQEKGTNGIRNETFSKNSTNREVVSATKCIETDSCCSSRTSLNIYLIFCMNEGTRISKATTSMPRFPLVSSIPFRYAVALIIRYRCSGSTWELIGSDDMMK